MLPKGGEGTRTLLSREDDHSPRPQLVPERQKGGKNKKSAKHTLSGPSFLKLILPNKKRVIKICPFYLHGSVCRVLNENVEDAVFIEVS